MHIIQIILNAVEGEQTGEFEKQFGVLVHLRLVPLQPEHLGDGELRWARVSELIQNLITILSNLLGDANLFEEEEEDEIVFRFLS